MQLAWCSCIALELSTLHVDVQQQCKVSVVTHLAVWWHVTYGGHGPVVYVLDASCLESYAVRDMMQAAVSHGYKQYMLATYIRARGCGDSPPQLAISCALVGSAAEKAHNTTVQLQRKSC
jgi:hypothetical protein